MDSAWSDKTTVTRSTAHLSAAVGDQIVLMSVEKGNYIGLDPIGSAIWSRLENPASVESLCTDLLTSFEAEPEILRRDVVKFLDELRAQGLVVIVT